MKTKEKIEKILKKEKGITLIALVITIIVLLILAGITVMALTGENGILNQAINASQQTDIAGTREQIEIELIGRYDTDGNYTNNDVIKAVLAVTGQEIEEGTATITTAKGNEVDISDLWGELPPTVWTADYANGTVTNGKDTLNIGDTIAYDPTAEVTDDSLLSYKSPLGTQVTTGSAPSVLKQGNGYNDQSFTATNFTGSWKVLGIDENDNLLIISDSNIGRLYLSGPAGSTYGPNELNNICSIFGHGTGATGARSITVDDINKITGYNPEYTGINTNTTEITDSTAKAPYNSGYASQYGNTVTYNWGTTQGYITSTNSTSGISGVTNVHSSETGYYERYGFNWHDDNFNWTSTAATTSSKICDLTSTYYSYYPETLTSSNDSDATTGIGSESEAYETIFKDESGSDRSYWLASTCVLTSTDEAYYALFCVKGGKITRPSNHIYRSCGIASYWSEGVSPVVSLSSSVSLTSSGENSWKIE